MWIHLKSPQRGLARHRTMQRIFSSGVFRARVLLGSSHLAPDRAGASATLRFFTTAEKPTGPQGIKSTVSEVWAGTFPRVLSRAAMTFKDDEVTPMTRWNVLAKAVLMQMPAGAIYTWTLWQGPISNSLGVVAASSLDWGLTATTLTFSFLAIGYGAAFGPFTYWIERAGPRYAASVGAVIYGVGHVLAAFGIYSHNLALVWVGWGFFGGFGSGLVFVAPQSTLMQWFPDRKGAATGACIAMFASGSVLMAPAVDFLIKGFFQLPIYAGSASAVELKIESGVQFVQHQGEWREAVLATASDIAKLPENAAANLVEGFYLVGTGSTGVIPALCVCGVFYSACMLLGAATVRAPPLGYTPPGFLQKVPVRAGHSGGESAIVACSGSVSTAAALRTPQFWLLWLSLSCSCTAGAAVLASAKVIMTDVFASLYPAIVTGTFAASFVGMLAVANASGRIFWAGISDSIGRKNTLHLCNLSLPACLILPHLAPLAIPGQAGILPLVIFCGTSSMMIGWYGGVIALIPAYCSDLFGPRDSGVIYGWVMTGWTAAAVAGPNILATLRERSFQYAVDGLVAHIPPASFEQAFKAPVDDLPALLGAKTVSIPRLLEISPPGTLDPTPFLYDNTFYAMAGILAAAAVSNALIRKVDSNLLEEDEKHRT